MHSSAEAAQCGAIAEQFRTEGYLSPILAMSESEARHYRTQLEMSERKRGRPLTRVENNMSHFLFRWAADIACHPAILDVVEQIVGPDILVWDSTFFTKEAGGIEHITWHQDLAYWGLEPGDQIITAWIALSPSTVESGCMRVVRGSNRLPIVAHTPGNAPGNLLGRGQSAHVEIEEKDIVDVILQPGEMSLHDVYIVHGSEANRSNDRRLGYGIRYMPPHVKQVVPVRDVALLARGQDKYGHFDLLPAPTENDSAQSRAVHEAATAARMAMRNAIKNPQDPGAPAYRR
jgi:ectoine hydroxylase-related dioxygenase (phytanoyl-CoA dioxygenase family)